MIRQIQAADRVALDTEADSLHSYREKLCLIQISVPSAVIQSVCDFIVDPLSNLDLEPLRYALEPREIILHAADYDLRMLRRGLNFTASRIFDTVVAARLLGIREFSLGALVKRFFGVELHKHSQKANWALRPLPARMLQYAVDDVHYLLPLAAKLEEELERVHRRDWFRQSCERAIELAAAERERDQDELWRIAGAGALDPHAGAVLRALWQWRESRGGTGRSTAISYFTQPRAIECGGKFRFGSRAGLQTLFRSTAADVPRSSKNCVGIAAIGVAGYAPPRRFSADRRNASARRSVARTAR